MNAPQAKKKVVKTKKEGSSGKKQGKKKEGRVSLGEVNLIELKKFSNHKKARGSITLQEFEKVKGEVALLNDEVAKLKKNVVRER